MKKWYAVIGDPISHSLSPFMHDEWFKQEEIDATYIPVHVKTGELKEAVKALKQLGVCGFNVTLPYKQEIIPYLDQLDETALEMNAVNTVVVKKGRLKGYNTDGDGFVRSLLAYGLPSDAPALIVGAGGAARGIAFAMARQGFSQLAIANRTYRRAEELGKATGAQPLTLAAAEKKLDEYSIVINTTSAGLTDHSVPLSLANLREGSFVSDIIYNPLETPFLKQAAEKNCIVQNGVAMFVHQGAIAFEKWTGTLPETEPMIERITHKLGGTYVNK